VLENNASTLDSTFCSDFITLGSHVKAENVFNDPINVLLIPAVEDKMRSVAGKHYVIENLFP
jgi:hypothetical protein